MSFQHRKLMSDSTNQSSYNYICGDCYGSCHSSCYKSCPYVCPPPSNPDQYPPPPSPGSESNSPTEPPSSLFMIITFTVLAAAFLLISSFVYYRRCRRRRRRSDEARRRLSLLPDETTETIDEFFDEDHGPVVDHPIWYINTVGLQQSTINSIAVCNYKKGQGLVEGTDCSVCLNEFREDETLRLLPKCSHAFHLPCIDTWLRSHTNCPLCRAPIVSNAADKNPSSSSAVNTEDTGVIADEETPQAVVMEDGDRESEEQEHELPVENDRISRGDQSWGLDEVLTQQPMRRSVSLDSMAASEITHQVIANGSSDNESDKGKESSLRIVSRRRSEGNQRLMRLMRHSSVGKSLQNRTIFMKRSFSCNGKLFSLPVSNNNSRNTKIPPPRSF